MPIISEDGIILNQFRPRPRSLGVSGGNSSGGGGGGGGGGNLYDNAFAVYSLRRIYPLWTGNVVQIRRSSDNAFTWVYFDTNGKISLSSLVEATGTLGDWIGSDDGVIRGWANQNKDLIFDPLDVLEQFSTSLEPQIISSGVVITKGGEPTIDFLSSTTWLKKTVPEVFDELDSGNDFTAFTVSNLDAVAGQDVIFTNLESGSDRVLMYNDRSTGNRELLVVGTSTNAFASLLAQQNNSDQKLLTGIVDGTLKTASAYLNGTAQTLGATWSTTYTNNTFVMGADQGKTKPFHGTIQEIIMFPSDKTADLTELHDDINAYYNIY